MDLVFISLSYISRSATSVLFFKKRKKKKKSKEFTLGEGVLPWQSRGDTVVKNLPAKARDTGDVGLIPGLGRSPGVGNGNPLQYSCLENPMDREAWQAIVPGVIKSWTWLSTHTRHVMPLVVQWLRLCAPNAGGVGQPLIRELRSHMQ